MTDRETIEDMLRRAGIWFEYEPKPCRLHGDASFVICVRSFDHPWYKFMGYAGFCPLLAFDEHGNLLAVGAWE